MFICAILRFWKDLIRNRNCVTIYILAIKGELNGKILLLRFFFCLYISILCLEFLHLLLILVIILFLWVINSYSLLAHLS